MSVISFEGNLIKGTKVQTSLFVLYSSRPSRNVRFVCRLKSKGVTILKHFRHELSGL